MANQIINSMKYFWNGYVKCAFGYDEILPVSCKGQNNWGGMGMTIIDSLDTLYLMDLKDEFKKGEEWLMNNLDFNKVIVDLQVFEINIRALGGLLSMYSLTKNDFYKKQAQELGDILANGISGFLPRRTVNLSKRTFCVDRIINLAEVGSFQLEYNYLSKITGNLRYQRESDSVQKYIIDHTINGLFNIESVQCPKTVGAEADSAYEYILKCWIQKGKNDISLRNTFDKNKIAFKTVLARRSPSGILTVGKKGIAEMEHLSCFLPGLIALDAYNNNYNKTQYNEDIEFAKSLAYTCYHMYMSQTLHLSPEIIQIFNDEISVREVSYRLRPETVESLYILHEVTGDPIFIKWGWDIYLAIEKYAKVKNGYSGLDDCNTEGSFSNKAESYFPAETLKYLYLLFDTQHKIDLNKYVFNTEAHPFEI